MRKKRAWVTRAGVHATRCAGSRQRPCAASRGSGARMPTRRIGRCCRRVSTTDLRRRRGPLLVLTLSPGGDRRPPASERARTENFTATRAQTGVGEDEILKALTALLWMLAVIAPIPPLPFYYSLPFHLPIHPPKAPLPPPSRQRASPLLSQSTLARHVTNSLLLLASPCITHTLCTVCHPLPSLPPCAET